MSKRLKKKLEKKRFKKIEREVIEMVRHFQLLVPPKQFLLDNFFKPLEKSK